MHWFELRASPSKAIPRHDGRRGLRRFITEPEEQLLWLHRHAERRGFRILTATPNLHDTLRSEAKSLPPARRRTPTSTFQILTVRYTGQLVVTDPDVFVDTIRVGIGPGKAYGCGLLLSTPADTGTRHGH